MERQESSRDIPEHERDRPDTDVFPEADQHPVPGVEHRPEPDAGNIMPAEDQPGTL